MKKLMSYEIRQMWLDFFKSKGHDVVPSASLVPVNDPTLLWINAGVAPLKKYFDGREVPQNRRLTNAQKSIRTNDIENVGKTARHHTFFEMLGNFSIGDYFRKEVLPWAIELLTSDKWFGFDIDKLYFTVYPDDVESYELWQKLGVKKDHIIRLEGNFWEIGDGPCGPDTEIFYDRGEKYDPENRGIELLVNDIENDRYIEIWNIVFSQFNAETGVERSNYKELPSKNIDTGCGLERLSCVMQEVETNYDTDLFMPIINETEKLTGVKYEGQMAFKVIADHVRSVTFAVSDGAILSNEGRGYVLRRILRRAVRYGKALGMKEAFLYKLVNVTCNYMSNFYPYLLETKEMVSKIVKMEEEKFLQTLETGEKKLFEYIESSKEKIVSKEFAFLLYDTYGFPIELTLEASNEKGFTVDIDGFKEELNKQKERARSARNSDQSMNSQNEEMLNFKESSQFIGYDNLKSTAKVIGIFKDGKNVSEAEGDILLVFDKTVFYATSGGQAGDTGYVTINDLKYEIKDTFKLPNLQHASSVEVQNVKVGDIVMLEVDELNRFESSCNHTATHLMNEALREVLGKHVSQQGSSVNSNLLRFDFNNFETPSSEEILKVEEIVNREINSEATVKIEELPLEEAKKQGVQAMFGEKYGDIVRVVTAGFSKELCGGTHVEKVSDIKKFCILSVESKGSGIFRIEATTNKHIEEMLNETLKAVEKEIDELKKKALNIIDIAKEEGLDINKLGVKEVVDSGYIPSYQMVLNRREDLAKLREYVKDLDKQYNKLKREANTLSLDDFACKAFEINGIKVVLEKTSDVEVPVLKDLVDRLADSLGECVILLANITGPKVVFVCKNKVSKLSAGDIVKKAASVCLGGGGGRNDFAQAGGKDSSKTDEALKQIREYLEGAL